MDDKTLAELAAKYPHLTPTQLTLISGEAYERGHSAGQEEVNAYARSIAAFVVEILKAASEPATELATSAVVKCTQTSPKNVAYIRHTKGRGWACTLANGIPAALSYAGVPHNEETETRIALERAKTPADVLRIVQNRIGRNYTAELA